MRCLIMYFSLTHSTERIAENIAEGLRQMGVDTDITVINSTSVPDLQDYQLIGFGTPVYCFRIPAIVTECIQKLTGLNSKRVFAFLLRGSYMYNASDFLESEINKKSSHVSAWFYTYGSGYFVPYMRRGCLSSPGRPNDADLEQARRFGAEIAEASDEAKWPKISEKPPILYRIEQTSFSSWSIKHLYQNRHTFNREKCIRCGKCIKACPVSNLSADPDHCPVVGVSCIKCQNCLFVCPTGALDIPENGIEKKLIDYNVRRLYRNNIPTARIRFENGKIEQV